MKIISAPVLLLIFACSFVSTADAQRRRSSSSSSTTSSEFATARLAVSLDETEQAELRAILTLPLAERILKLKAFVEAHPQSSLKARALELIVSTRAALGDEKLRTGDVPGGTEQFRLAIAESPANMPDKLYAEVVSTLPMNLFLRGERAAAMEIARLIEERVKDNAKRLLAVAGFYMNIEEVNEATRVSELAIKLAPDMAAAHEALGAAHHIALRLDDAAVEYARALELDPKSASARRSLADLRRANGKADEALVLYREQLTINGADKAACAGVALALLDAGKREEGERELEAALKDDPRNLALLTGAAYWYAAHNEGTRALALAEQAVGIEPRYTWAQIALARALLAQNRPLDAERVLRFAQRYGRFPTLDYELANALAAAGLYGEAATELARSFNIKDGQLETQLAGRTPSRAASFIELLALERRASIFQPTAADNEANARALKNLLAFHISMNPADAREGIKEATAVAAAQEFAAGEDDMRVYRQLYAASRLLQSRIGFQAVLDLTTAATSGVEAALNVPVATVATLADNLLDIRARAIASGATPSVPEVQRNTLSNILRGRIEDLMGAALFNQDKAAEAVVHLRRAVSVLPEGTIWLRTALWRLGAALDATGKQPEALEAYIRSYSSGTPDPARLAVIEALYRKVRGSTSGLESEISAAAPSSASSANTPSPSSADTSTGTSAVSVPQTSEQQTPTAVTETQTPVPSTSPTPELAQNTLPPAEPAIEPTPTSAPTPAPTPAPRSRRAATKTTTTTIPEPETASDTCLISLSEDTLSISSNGGTTVITVTLVGWKDVVEVTAVTANWSDIAVFPEPKSTAESGTFKFSITSVSRNLGTFYVTFKSPCGEKLVEVKVS